MKSCIALVAVLGTIACGTSKDPGTTTGGEGTNGTGGTGGTTGVQYSQYCPANGFTCPGTSKTYPAATDNNCGTDTGQTFPDFTLEGGGVLNFSTTATVDNFNNFSGNAVSMHDLFCSGFKYALIDVSAVWCPHCQEEASEMPQGTNSTYPVISVPKWLAAGGLVFSVLVQSSSETSGASATPNDLKNWINTYQVNYPMSLDTTQVLPQFIGLTGWPANMIINLSNMQVVNSVEGADDTFLVKYANLLDVTN